MFTGIIEDLGVVKKLSSQETNLHITMESKFTSELKIDQSVAHNGVCLTVVAIEGNQYTVTAIDETLKKTNIGQLQVGDLVNLERCLEYGGRMDGHMVYGHVDTVGHVKEVKDSEGSTVFTITFPQQHANLMVEKGSVSLNGISLTVWDVEEDCFSVGIIPYTLEHTNLKKLSIGDQINLEFDIFGKYLEKYLKKIDFKR